jgi:hypothetical protein
MLQMVVRNYPPTASTVAGDITTTDSNYSFLELKFHAGNGGASYVVGNHFVGNEPQKTRSYPHHRFKARITRKTTNKLKLHNFDLSGGT